MTCYRRILYLIEGEPVRDPALERVLGLAAAFEGEVVLGALTGAGDDPTARHTRLEAFARSLDGTAPATVQVFAREREALIRAIAAGGFDLVAKKAAPDDSLTSYLFGTLDTLLIERAPAPVLIDKPVPGVRYGCILAAIDLTDDGAYEALILEHAVSLAQAEEARLVVFHAWHLEGEEELRGRAFTQRARAAVEAMKREETEQRRRRLEPLVRPFSDRGVRVELVVEEGPPALTIVATAERLGAELVVLGTHVRSHLEGLALGSTAEAVLRRIRCALLAVKPPGFAAGA